MGHSNVNIAALIGSRICHDLISPIGAINNGLELLNMSGGQGGPEMELISDSVGNASARIRFFRIAYGAASDTPVGRSEIVAIFRGYTSGGRLDVAYGPLEEHPRLMVRMVFLAVQCMETAMPYGGRIEIACTDGQWFVAGYSNKFTFDESLWNRLETGDTDDLAPAHVQFPLLCLHAQNLDRKVAWSLDTGSKLSVTF
ncbi:MAG: histidine phosphotransferase family protein [Pseudomonadota bacterium]